MLAGRAALLLDSGALRKPVFLLLGKAQEVDEGRDLLGRAPAVGRPVAEVAVGLGGEDVGCEGRQSVRLCSVCARVGGGVRWVGERTRS